jgi:hypothetical protein
VIKTFKLAEQKGSYMPKPTWEEYGNRNWHPWHGARTSTKVEQHGDYIWLLTSEGVQNRRQGESKGNIAWTTDLLEV